MDVKAMRTSSPDQGTIVSGTFAVWATTIKCDSEIKLVLVNNWEYEVDYGNTKTRRMNWNVNKVLIFDETLVKLAILTFFEDVGNC